MSVIPRSHEVQDIHRLEQFVNDTINSAPGMFSGVMTIAHQLQQCTEQLLALTLPSSS